MLSTFSFSIDQAHFWRLFSSHRDFLHAAERASFVYLLFKMISNLFFSMPILGECACIFFLYQTLCADSKQMASPIESATLLICTNLPTLPHFVVSGSNLSDPTWLPSCCNTRVRQQEKPTKPYSSHAGYGNE